jgi:hypothetical protein
MRGVSKRFTRTAAIVALLMVVCANGAFADPLSRNGEGWLARFHRFAHFIVTTLSDQLGGPPG